MSSTQTPTPAIVKITNHLPLVEKILVTALAAGAIMTMGIDSTVTRISLIGLAVTFFLSAYRVIDIPEAENEPYGFSALLGVMVVPKVLWISSAVSAVGISMWLSDPGHEGFKRMLMIGALSIGICTVLLSIFLLSGVKHIRLVTPVLLRAIPLLLADLYLLFS